jgi:hypothetical protein
VWNALIGCSTQCHSTALCPRCMVDLLRPAGLIEEAFSLVQSMTMHAGFTTCQRLSGCQLRDMMSNIYAAVGNWQSMIKASGIKKGAAPASGVFEFVAGDMSHSVPMKFMPSYKRSMILSRSRLSWFFMIWTRRPSKRKLFAVSFGLEHK